MDLYYLLRVFEFDCESVLDTLKKNGRRLGDFDGFVNRIDELKHSYENLRFLENVAISWHAPEKYSSILNKKR